MFLSITLNECSFTLLITGFFLHVTLAFAVLMQTIVTPQALADAV